MCSCETVKTSASSFTVSEWPMIHTCIHAYMDRKSAFHVFCQAVADSTGSCAIKAPADNWLVCIHESAIRL